MLDACARAGRMDTHGKAILKECQILETLTHPNVISVKGHKDQRRISFSHDQTGDQPQKDDVVSEE